MLAGTSSREEDEGEEEGGAGSNDKNISTDIAK